MIVGVNEFQIEEEPPEKLLKVDPEIERVQRERLISLKEKRDTKKVEEALLKVKEAASGGDNLVPPVIDAVESYATLGEISDALREVFGEYSPSF